MHALQESKVGCAALRRTVGTAQKTHLPAALLQIPARIKDALVIRLQDPYGREPLLAHSPQPKCITHPLPTLEVTHLTLFLHVSETHPRQGLSPSRKGQQNLDGRTDWSMGKRNPTCVVMTWFFFPL